LCTSFAYRNRKLSVSLCVFVRRFQGWRYLAVTRRAARSAQRRRRERAGDLTPSFEVVWLFENRCALPLRSNPLHLFRLADQLC
jgi:hypothetical protein